MDLRDHPTFRQIAHEVEQENLKEEQARLDAQLEAQRLRAEQGKYLASQFKHTLDEYEKVRKEMHNAIGAVWVAANNYSRVTGMYPSTFPESIFMDIHVPSLGPNAYAFSPGVTTTRASVMAWFSSQGKEWK